LAKFGLELAADKTRLIEFGRYAAERRARRGLGRPETFAFLGFTHICGKTKGGRFMLRRVTIAKRMWAKLKQLKEELKRRRHRPIPEQGRWLASVVRGHLAYYAVPTNSKAVRQFRTQVIRLWYRALRRRGQRTRLDWKRMNRFVLRWLPPARIQHPWPVCGSTLVPKAGAQCVSSARWDLCGGPPVRAVPTATSDSVSLSPPPQPAWWTGRCDPGCGHRVVAEPPLYSEAEKAGRMGKGGSVIGSIAAGRTPAIP